MPVILIDANIEGHGLHVWKRLQSGPLRDFVTDLNLDFKTFHDVGLDRAAPDNVVWRFCQAQGFYLLTSNRNEDTEDSLQATLLKEGLTTSLPVFTLPLPDRVYHNPDFLDRVTEKLLDYVMDGDNILGTGRLYLP